MDGVDLMEGERRMSGSCRNPNQEPMSQFNKRVYGTFEKQFSPKVLVEHIDSFGKGLNEWEVKFIADLIDNPPETYSEKQVKIINRIYDEKC